MRETPSPADTPSALLDDVRAYLDKIPEPSGQLGLVEAGRVSGLSLDPLGALAVVLSCTPAELAHFNRAKALLENKLSAFPGITRVRVVLTNAPDSPPGSGPRAPAPAGPAPSKARLAEDPRASLRAAEGAQRPPGVRAVVAISSAKGGVGKSTFAVNFSCALSNAGLKVGLMDADVYGPSVPTLLKLEHAPIAYRADKRIEPIAAHGLKVMSIGLLVDADQALVWRGPMATSAVRQMLFDVAWDDLDVLVVDMPPGTGDIALSLVQRTPLDGAVIISTPQEMALADVRRGIAMFGRTATPILGLVENMAWLDLPDGSRIHPFGQGGARQVALDHQVPFLGALPLDPALRESADRGLPYVIAHPDSPLSAQFAQIAMQAWQGLADAGLPAPEIVFVD